MTFENIQKSGQVGYILTDEPAFVFLSEDEDEVLVFDDDIVWGQVGKSTPPPVE